MQIAQGNLVIIGANTQAAQVFFNGLPVSGITGIRVDWENDEQRVKLKVNGADTETCNALRAAGVIVKEGN